MQEEGNQVQLITFRTEESPNYLYVGQAKRLRCEVYTDSNGGMAITGERVAIHQIVERLIEDKITFQRFVSLEGRLQST
jgi:hypothetical protein